MPSPNQRTGKVYIEIDGVSMESMDGAKLENYEGNERDAVTGTSVFGFMDKEVVPTISCEFAHGPLINMDAIAAVVNSTITFKCDSGPIYALLQAWKSKGSSLTGGQGKVAFEFQGKRCITVA